MSNSNMASGQTFVAEEERWRLTNLTRRVSLIVLAAVLLSATAAHLYAYFRTRRIQTILSALSKVEIDRSTEADIIKSMPYLIRCSTDMVVRPNEEHGNVDSGIQRCYYTSVHTDRTRWMQLEMFADRVGSTRFTASGRWSNWFLSVVGALGYRYINFYALVIVLNGRVSRVSYGIADHLVFPEVAGDIVSVKSVHSFWNFYGSGALGSNVVDESPEFQVAGGDEWGLRISFTPDAPAILKSHAFSTDLSCFWGFRDCLADRVAAFAWQDKARIEAATLKRLQSNDPCPDRIIAERMKYFPDIDVLLVERAEAEGLQTVVSRSPSPKRISSSTYKIVSVLRGRLLIFPLTQSRKEPCRASSSLRLAVHASSFVIQYSRRRLRWWRFGIRPSLSAAPKMDR